MPLKELLSASTQRRLVFALNSITGRFVVLLLLMSPAFGCMAQATADFEKQPSVKWKVQTKGPLISSPVIDNNTVYVGGTDSTVYAIDLLSGSIKWTLKTNGEIRSTVLVNSDFVYLVGGNGVLSCINKTTGKVAWRKIFDNTAVFLSERKYDFADYYHSSPVCASGVIYFGSATGRMFAFKADNGEMIWSFKAGDIVHTTPAIEKDKLFFGSHDGYLYALNRLTGELLWKFKSIGMRYFPIGEMQGSPSVHNGTVFAGSRDYNLYAIDASSGYCNWNKRFENGWALPTSVKDTVVYVGTSDDRVLVAYDARNGRQLWRTNLNYNIFGNCAFSQSMIYTGTIWGKVFGLDAKTGTIKWAFATEGHTKNNLKYFKPDNTFRDDIGSILKAPASWIKAETEMGGVFSTPAISNDVMVITSLEGTVYCLKK